MTTDADKILLTVLQILGPDYIKAFGKTPALVTAQPYQMLEKDEVFRRAAQSGGREH